jgi:type II secretory ATPase GspE/PulE/Tfp pilus assembly ATPase PilB-like protein
MERLRAAFVAYENGTPVVAVADASQLLVLDDLRMTLPGCRIVVAEAEALTNVIQRFKRHVERIEDEAAHRETEIDTSFNDADVSDDGTIARTVNRIIEAAAQDGASDIHFEAGENGLLVRFRIDGVLIFSEEIRRGMAGGVINRIKVMSGMEISDKFKPQDGRFNRQIGVRQIDCRVETIPSAWGGESAVLRLFDQGRNIKSLDQIGFHATLVDKFSHLIKAPHGIILVTGPTGSGKTTTLYSCLEQVATADRKTLTVEDPCEIRKEGITQVQVKKGGMTFATVLRSFLRADPDIILVGEIRDSETAELAAQAALTGHLVLSTLHTNEAVGAATRLSNMGLEGYIIASSLRAVLAQRLVRKLCIECRESYQPGPLDLSDFAGSDIEVPGLLWRSGGGCRRCRNTGYSGRVPVGELVEITPELGQAIIEQAPSHTLARIAAEQGTRPLKYDALEWAASGDTSLDELRRGGLLL